MALSISAFILNARAVVRGLFLVGAGVFGVRVALFAFYALCTFVSPNRASYGWSDYLGESGSGLCQAFVDGMWLGVFVGLSRFAPSRVFPSCDRTTLASGSTRGWLIAQRVVLAGIRLASLGLMSSYFERLFQFFANWNTTIVGLGRSGMTLLNMIPLSISGAGAFLLTGVLTYILAPRFSVIVARGPSILGRVCDACGYDLSATARSAACPECGDRTDATQ